jgi:hypothetical protein
MALKNLLIKGDNGIEKYVIAAYISSKFIVSDITSLTKTQKPSNPLLNKTLLPS